MGHQANTFVCVPYFLCCSICEVRVASIGLNILFDLIGQFNHFAIHSFHNSGQPFIDLFTDIMVQDFLLEDLMFGFFFLIWLLAKREQVTSGFTSEPLIRRCIKRQ